MVVVHARPRSPPMTGKKIRNIWPVGERASRSSRGIIVPCACVCVYIRSRTGAHVSLTRDNGEDTTILDTRGGGFG